MIAFFVIKGTLIKTAPGVDSVYLFKSGTVLSIVGWRLSSGALVQNNIKVQVSWMKYKKVL